MEHNLTNENLFKVCRTCLVQTEDMKDIFTSSLDKLLKECTSLEVNSNDGLPTLICETCISRVNDAYSFKILCENSSQRLKEFVATSTVKEESTEVIDILVECYEYNSDQASPVDNVEDEENSEDTKLDITETSTEELEAKAQIPPEKLLPEKSKNIYMKVYTEYKDWCSKKQVAGTSESVLLVYFQEQSKRKKPSTLWAVYSMLRSTLSLMENIDITKYFKLITFVKRKNATYKPKKSRAFTKEEITKFLVEAPDNDFLSAKAIFIVGLTGACRTEEICNMHMKDIDMRDDLIIVNIPHAKNATSRKFVITEPLWIKIVKKYLTNRPTPDMPKAFICFRGGKPTKQNIGHNTVSNIPNKVAKFLKLENPELYTGHSLRRSSAAMLAKSGRDILSLNHWKSTDVSDTAIDIPVTNLPSTSTSTNINHATNTSIGGITMTCHNCTTNYNLK